MKRMLGLLLAASLALGGTSAAAAPAAVVEGVQMPAWVERSGKQMPAAAGMELIATDTLRTGPGARLYVKLAEGSLVKLGENASLQLLDVAPERGGVFKAALSVLTGAFRFTTDVLAKPRRRDVKLTISTVTIGIRGTNLWGRSVKDNEIVCLIEGAIEVGAAGEKPILMNQPRQFYQRERGKTLPLAVIDAKRLAELAAETEIEPGKGAAQRGGKWRVTLISGGTQDAALAVYDQVRAAGYAAEIHASKAGEQRVYAVRIAHLPSQAEAAALGAQLRGKYGVVEAKVSR